MADSFDQFETMLREFISPAVVNLVLEDDDPVWSLIDTFKPESIGGRRISTDASPGTISNTPDAGYEASWRVKLQRGGRVTGGTFAGNTLVQMGADSHLNVGQAADAKYLDPTKTPLASWVTIRMFLKRMRGSVTVNRQQIMADLATQPIDEIAGNHIADAVARVRNYITNAFWSDGTGKMARINQTSITINDSTQEELTIDEGQFARFEKGDRIVFASENTGGTDYDTTRAGSLNDPGVARVVGVDRQARTILVEAEPGEGTISSVADNDYIIMEGAYDFSGTAHTSNSRAPEGVESLLKGGGGGDFPGTELDVDSYPDLQAFVSGSLASLEDPTPEAIALVLDKITDAGYAPPEALFFERSGWTLYGQLERESGAQYVVPQGAAFVASGGVDGPVIQHMGNRFQRFSSVRMPPNTMVGLAPSTWRKFMPLGNKTVHWVYSNGPLAGTNSIFGPVYDGVQLTELADAPFDVFIQFGCDKPQRNFRREGFRTQRDV